MIKESIDDEEDDDGVGDSVAPNTLPTQESGKRILETETTVASPTEPSSLIFRTQSVKTKEKKSRIGPRTLYNQLLLSVIRPPRADYQVSDLGPKVVTVSGKPMERMDFGVTNNLGETLACSMWSPQTGAIRHWIIYCHSNSSCRLAAVRTPVLETVAKLNATSLVIFDFAACGRSSGKYVTLGLRERDDVAAVVKWCTSKQPQGKIILWGRSMGAVSALLYHYDINTNAMEESMGRLDETTRALPRFESNRIPGDCNPFAHTISSQKKPGQNVVALILDSPFSSMKQLVTDVSNTALPRVPTCCVACIVSSLRRSAKKKTNGCDVLRVSAIDAAKCANRPALFIAANNDVLAPPVTHTEKLRKIYGSVSTYIKFDGHHNSPRPPEVYDAIFNFCAPLLHDETSTYQQIEANYKDQLPSDWIEYKDQATGDTYYINTRTSEKSWLKPILSSRQVDTPPEIPSSNNDDNTGTAKSS